MGAILKRSRRGDVAADTQPILVTKWGEFTVDGGVLFLPFRSGFQPYTIAMGPQLAFKAIDRARKALQCGIVDQLIGVEAH